jgi:type III restriction enzyme
MNKETNIIASRLSLRKPQRESLEILANILDQINLGEDNDLIQSLEIIKNLYPTVQDFERNFPSLCFALATGVGKTRLMGAFISYLYITRTSRHIFVLAPNLTIYHKLIQDFHPNTPKYVFKGITEFNLNPPIIITGENYEDGRGVRIEISGQGRLFENEKTVHINIFNISKINSEVRGGKEPKIKRLQEYIGQSYFEYLSELKDLVLLMDEAHRYRASAGIKAIEELKPILGLELTATPKTVGAKPVEFKNIVYSYSLAVALQDGFVKEPAVATRKDFRPENYSSEQIEKIKLEDGITNHEYVKNALKDYADTHQVPKIKPFILVVAQDTNHAKELRSFIESADFFEGSYHGKVIEIHTNQSGTESEEATQKLLAVETSEEIEIVIHVNKLKEGWDVTNLYTIIPLRASASEILTEQTIGRGLRLPYGKRTNNETCDRLTIIAHDKFQEIVDQANNPDSIIRKQITIGNGGDIPLEKTKSLVVPSVLETLLTGSLPTFEQSSDSPSSSPTALIPNVKPPELIFKTSVEKTAVTIAMEKIANYDYLQNSEKLADPEVQAQIVTEVKASLPPRQMGIPTIEKEPDIEKIVEVVTRKFIEHTIDIPNIVILPTEQVTFGFSDFDLENLDTIKYQPVSKEILIQYLRTPSKNYLLSNENQQNNIRLEDYIVNQLIEKGEIDYDSNADLLYKLAGQMVDHLKSYLPDNNAVKNVLLYHQKHLSEFIFHQILEHYWQTPTDYIAQVTKGFTVLKVNRLNTPDQNNFKSFRDTLTNPSRIKNFIFGGFEKCCYPYQKFDTDTERQFSVLIDDDPSVLRWMKPASGQFQIEYRNGSKYEPDFVIERQTDKLICETKMAKEMNDEEVQDKKRAAVRWCEFASQHAQENDGKPWHYLLIPHDQIASNLSLDFLITEFSS